MLAHPLWLTEPEIRRKAAGKRHFPLGIGNAGSKQDRGNQPPYRRYGPDAEIQYRPRKPHGPAKPSRILSKREADAEFQYRPHIVDTDTIRDAVFEDAISEISISATQLFQICSAIYFVVAQLLVEMTSALQKAEGRNATSSAQHSKNCSATSIFR